MAVNLSKHGSELSDVYNEVVRGNTGTDWVLFTYEGNSYDIQVAAKGDGGLDEMVQELCTDKVMYAFCRVTDPNYRVPKFILINWTGEGVTGVMRGVCANHFCTMASFLRGAHVTINAYSEDDVKPELIMNKVSQAVGVNYRMQNESCPLTNTAASHLVGSAYHKTSALEEIKGTERKNFWAQIEECKKAEEERQRVEKERKEQEERVMAGRVREQRERDKQINQQRLQEKKQEATTINQQKSVEQELQAAQWKGIRSSRSVQETNGSKYYKTNALEEINETDREHFWAQLEKEEKNHRQQERKKAEEERQRVEKERKEQEERETAEREQRQRQRNKQINQQRLQANKQEATSINQQKSVEQELQAAQWKGIRSSRSVHEVNSSKYYKTSALEEINETDREHFWAQLKKEEETCRQQERKKAEEELQRVEKERKEQEEREMAERERRQRERDKQINQQRLQEKKQEATTINQQISVEQELQAAQWKGIRSSRSVQEANVAAAIISQRAVNPRDIFSQKATDLLTNRTFEAQSVCNEEDWLKENIYDTVSSNHRSYDVVKDDRTSEVKGLCAKALYDYQAADDTEITFDPGDIITVVEMADEGWWHGYGPGGYYGMFPANYVELI